MRLKKHWKIIFSILIILLIAFICMRYIGTSGLKIREYKVVNPKLNSFYGFKVVHFSDLHYGMTVDEDKLKTLVEMINKTKPDLVVFTGDLVDRHTKVTDDVSNILSSNLSKISSTYGKYYVTGNHDIVNISYDNIMTKANFKSLDESYEIINSKNNKTMFIAGVSVDKNLNTNTIETINLNNFDYKIFILHYPDEIDNVLKYNFDLILSGHSHNGQVRLPVIGKIITPINAKKYYDPYYKIENTDLYISGGIGNSTINFRLFNKPSFNLYRFVDK